MWKPILIIALAIKVIGCGSAEDYYLEDQSGKAEVTPGLFFTLENEKGLMVKAGGKSYSLEISQEGDELQMEIPGVVRVVINNNGEILSRDVFDEKAAESISSFLPQIERYLEDNQDQIEQSMQQAEEVFNEASLLLEGLDGTQESPTLREFLSSEVGVEFTNTVMVGIALGAVVGAFWFAGSAINVGMNAIYATEMLEATFLVKTSSIMSVVAFSTFFSEGTACHDVDHGPNECSIFTVLFAMLDNMNRQRIDLLTCDKKGCAGEALDPLFQVMM